MQPDDKSARPDDERSRESTTAEAAMVSDSDDADEELLKESAYSTDEE